MVEQVGAHVRFQLGPGDMAPILHEMVGRRVDDAQQQIDSAQGEHPGGGDLGIVRHGLIGDHAHDLGEHDFTARGHEGAE